MRKTRQNRPEKKNRRGADVIEVYEAYKTQSKAGVEYTHYKKKYITK